jgi:hypothetical protein
VDGGLSARQGALAALVLAGGTLSAVSRERRPLAGALVLGGVLLAFLLLPSWTLHSYFSDDGPLRVHADVFAGLRARLTPQDRVQLMAAHADPAFNDKTASVFGLRATGDLEPQLTQAYAEYRTMLRSGNPMHTLNQIYYPGPWNLHALRWPLIHLAAARYLAVASALELPVDGIPFLSPLEADGDERLRRLAAGTEERRLLALVEEAPPSGFTGVPGNEATTTAAFVVDEPERVVLQLTAPARGFLFLADQAFPGWSANVNDAATPILRANHAFRLVEVPGGPVRVEFRYRPFRVPLGAFVTTAALVGVVGFLVWSRRTRGRPYPRTDPPAA